MAAADEILTEREGGVWLQGRREDDAEDLQKYVEEQSEIVQELFNVGRHLSLQHGSYESFQKAFDGETYNYLMLLEKRLEQKDARPIKNIQAAARASGAMGRAEGRSFDMCGKILTGGNAEAVSMAMKTGFESLLRLADKEIECPECQKKTIVPIRKLQEGRLQCTRCDYEVDVCTGKVHKESRSKKRAEEYRQPDVFDILSWELRRYAQESVKRELENRAVGSQKQEKPS